MKIYNEEKTKELKNQDLDLARGCLVNDKLCIGTEPVFIEHVDDERGVFDIVHPEKTITEDIQVYHLFSAEELKENRKAELQRELDCLNQVMVQAFAGEIVPDLAERKKKFVKLHNELRVLLDKSEREVKNG